MLQRHLTEGVLAGEKPVKSHWSTKRRTVAAMKVTDPNREQLGRWIRELRDARDLEQADLAAQAGVGASAISEIERGKAWPSIESLRGIARALGSELTIEIVLPGEPAEDPVQRELRDAWAVMPPAAQDALRAQLQAWISAAEAGVRTQAGDHARKKK
jgi:transcriptional regulator with XRE-family HTH domain